MKLKGAIVAAIISLGLCIGAYATSWYNIVDTAGSSVTTYTFFWDHYTTTDVKGNSQVTKYSANGVLDHPLPQTADVFNEILAFLTAGAAALLATIVFQGLRVFCKLGKGSSVCRVIGSIIIAGAMIVLAIAFFSFLNITKAFLQDNWPGCTSILLGDLDNTHRNCAKLMGSDTQNVIITYSYAWKPDIGWWLCLAGLVVAAFSVGGVMRSGRK